MGFEVAYEKYMNQLAFRILRGIYATDLGEGGEQDRHLRLLMKVFYGDLGELESDV